MWLVVLGVRTSGVNGCRGAQSLQWRMTSRVGVNNESEIGVRYVQAGWVRKTWAERTRAVAGASEIIPHFLFFRDNNNKNKAAFRSQILP